MREKPTALFHGYMCNPKTLELDELGQAQVMVAAALWKNGEIGKAVFAAGKVYPGEKNPNLSALMRQEIRKIEPLVPVTAIFGGIDTISEVRSLKGLELKEDLWVIADELHIPRIKIILKREFGDFASQIEARSLEAEVERLGIGAPFTREFIQNLRNSKIRRVLRQERVLRWVMSLPKGYELIHAVSERSRHKGVLQYNLLTMWGELPFKRTA